ncbi:oxidoreductase [Thermoflavimicrobium daqui]|nr:oxidoreductase [Thermoflavimicrobium daqui]
MPKQALVLGATGLIGQAIMQLLLEHAAYEKVRIITRRPITFSHSKLEAHVIPFDQLHRYPLLFQVDEVYCALGTTIKKAKTKENFRLVDFNYPYQAATIAQKQGIQQFLLVTGTGANKNSFFFYNRVKGELEEAIQKLNIPSIHIFRPSLLLGKRDEFRSKEKVAEIFMKMTEFLMIGPLTKYRAIQGEDVAKAMIQVANQNRKGYQIYDSQETQKLADAFTISSS